MWYALAGAGCGGGEPGQSWSAESVISVWTHLGGQWAFLMWFPAAPDSVASVPAGVEFTPCGLASVCSMCGCSCAGGDNKRQDIVCSRKGEHSVDSHRVWSSRMGWEWLGWRRERTELVHQKRALRPCELIWLAWPLPVAMGPGSCRRVVPCARILPCPPRALTSRST